MTKGKSTKTDANQNCITCLKYWSCKKAEKKEGQGCYEYANKYTEEKQHVIETDKNSNSTSVNKVKIYTEQDSYLNEAEDDLSNYFSPTSYGLNIPEQDFPLAKNLYEFVFSRKFLNLGVTGLYARQFGIGLNLFTDYCPKCSDLTYLKKNFEVADTIDAVLERVVLFEHDVCPKCKSSKLDLIQAGLSWDNWELAALCGQRCIVGDILVCTNKGNIPIKTFSNMIEGFSDYLGDLQVFTTNGFIKPTKIFESGEVETLKITVSTGQTIIGTPIHPIMDANKEFIKLQDLAIGQLVLVSTNPYSRKFDPTSVVSIEQGPFTKTYDFYLPPVHNFVAGGFINHNSGKSLMAAIFSAYTLHRFLKLPSVAEAFEVAKPTIFLGTFVALDKSQIQDSTWGYLINLIKDTPWFVSYCTMLRDYGRRAGRKLVDIEKVETIEFYCKNLKLNMAAPRPGALRGRTGFLGVVDEIGFLKAKDGEGRVITADEVYASLNNRMGTLVTAFEKKRLLTPNLPTPLFINISSPSHARDKICSLVKGITEQNGVEKDTRHLRRYAVTYPTWEINPMFPKESSYISSKYKTDPKEAERDFGAKPPLSENSFIEDVVTLRENFTSRTNLIELEYELGNKHTDYKIKFLREDFNRSVPRVLTLDLGFNNNSTGFSVGHYDEASSKVVVDILGEIIPINGAEVNFVLFLEKVVKPLIAALNIKIVSADRWQSISLMQDLEMNYKIKAVTYSLKYGDFLFYKQGLMNHRIEYPQTEDTSLLISCPPEEYPKAYYNKPVSHFFFQCLTVVDEKDKTVRKGDKTTDDIFRATALLHYILTNLEYRDFLKGAGRAVIPSGPVVHVQSIRGGALSSQGGTPRFSGATVVVV